MPHIACRIFRIILLDRSLFYAHKKSAFKNAREKDDDVNEDEDDDDDAFFLSFFPFLSVCLSVCLSCVETTQKSNWKKSTRRKRDIIKSNVFDVPRRDARGSVRRRNDRVLHRREW